MVTIVAKQTVQQNSVAPFIEIARQLVAATRQLDGGCLHYDLFQDTHQPEVLTFIEGWESQAALDAHMASAHFKPLFPQLQALCAAPGEIAIYQKVE
ncbi:MAG: putative quinol monooxygenase [Oscillospiraceae bacterium]